MISKSEISNGLPRQLRIGRVVWFGGYNRKKEKKVPYGFITDGTENKIFVHESILDSGVHELQEGIHVLFTERLSEKGREAHSVRILNTETDISLLREALNSKKIPLEFRIRALVLFSDPIEAGISEILVDTVDEVLSIQLNIKTGMDIPIRQGERKKLNLEWPQSWLDIERDSEVLNAVVRIIRNENQPRLIWPNKWLDYDLDGIVFNAMTEEFRERACEKYYQPFLEKLRMLLKRKVREISAFSIYRQLDEVDFKLARLWCNKNENDFELAKMISARAAEIAALHFYRNVGCEVIDIAGQQILGNSTDWLTHDLYVNGETPIDVKNARQPINSSVLVEYTVPRFKQDRNSIDVRISGVLSPYANMTKMKEGRVKGNIIFLGETSLREIDELLRLYNKPEIFSLDNRFKDKLPVWLFNYPEVHEAGGSSMKNGPASRIRAPDAQHWKYLKGHNLVAGCLALNFDIPIEIKEQLLKWEREFLNSLIQVNSLTLGHVYLSVLSHFFLALKYMKQAEKSGFEPSKYWDLLYIKTPETDHLKIKRQAIDQQNIGPLGFVDPLNTVAHLISSLESLWKNKHTLELEGVRSLRFSAEGLVRGRFPDNSTKTILAYCGGKINGKGRCGYSPLVLGENKSCQICGFLTCPECEYCCRQCFEEKQKDGEFV